MLTAIQIFLVIVGILCLLALVGVVVWAIRERP